MVVKLETVAALCADVYPALPKGRRELDLDCKKKRRAALPALVEDEEPYQPEPTHTLRNEGLRRQKSISPRRERLRRELVLPSLSEDEEP